MSGEGRGLRWRDVGLWSWGKLRRRDGGQISGGTDCRRDFRTGGRRQPGVAGGEGGRFAIAAGERADDAGQGAGLGSRMLVAVLLPGNDAAGRRGCLGTAAGVVGDASGSAAAEAVVAAAFPALMVRIEGVDNGGQEGGGEDEQKRDKLQKRGGPVPSMGQACRSVWSGFRAGSHRWTEPRSFLPRVVRAGILLKPLPASLSRERAGKRRDGPKLMPISGWVTTANPDSHSVDLALMVPWHPLPPFLC